ncbi:MAG: 50S ribosomal protein L1 [Candidatus Margulisiibacteriota bacterium]
MTVNKKYSEKAKLVNGSVKYSSTEAAKLLKQTAVAKFDETIDLALHLTTDPKKSDQNIRGTVSLPAGTGKKIKLLVFARGDKAAEATAAGADHVGADDMIQKISGGWLDFDLALATPDMMPAVGKLGKILGTKGLMPNPKSGTVITDVAKAVKEFKAGKVEFKQDKTSNVHIGIGKISFSEEDIEKNIITTLGAVNKLKPSGLKGNLIKSATVSSTMGPGIGLNISKILK